VPVKKKRKSNRTTQFCNRLAEALKHHSLPRNLVDRDKWRPGSIGGAHIDVVGYFKDKPSVLIEVELRRDDPVNNVVKMWQLFENKKKRKEMRPKIFFLHAFSGIYEDEKKSRKESAQFVGGKLNKSFPQISYIPICFDYYPTHGGKVGGGARDKQARRLAGQIAATLRRKVKGR
jgi:hypothetical protein